jgi:sortase A
MKTGMPDNIRTLKKPLANAFLVLGVVLLGAYALVRFSNSNDSAAGLEAFEQTRADMVAEQETGTALPATASSRPAVRPVPVVAGDEAQSNDRVDPQPNSVRAAAQATSLQLAPEPDFSDWSEKRIAEYKDSLQAASDLPLAVLSIDTLNIKVPVYNGASDLNLNRGVARIKGTAQIGEPSNLGIAGHRDGFFRGLQDINVGDRIELDTLHGETRYRVTGIQIVYPEDVHVLEPTDSSTITLVTCYPFYFVGSAPQRYIVTAEAEPVQVQS